MTAPDRSTRMAGRRKHALCANIAALLILVPLAGTAQGLDGNMELLQPFLGAPWSGHYSDPETAHLLHESVWEPILDGRSVRLTKRVDELAFVSETIFYWDPGRRLVAFLTVTNRGQISRGTAILEGGAILLEGVSVREDGDRPFRLTYRLLDDGTLEDRFYLKQGDAWNQRHLVLMIRTSGDE